MIEVRDLQAGYDGRAVLHDLSFAIRGGEFVGILGPNACGKSTLLRVLSGVLATSGGRVLLDGRPLPAWPPREQARRMASVPQSTEIPFPFTGFEVVLMGRYPRLGRFAGHRPEDLSAVRDALCATDTAPLAERLITQVSGGERQRLILARAVAQECALLLLDEATASMDVHRKIDAFDLLLELNRAGATVVAVMHDLNLAALYCRRLLILKEGRLYADGDIATVFTEQNLAAVYETPLRIFRHPAHDCPQVAFLRRGGPS